MLRSSPAFLELKHQIEDPRSGRVQAAVLRDDQFLPVQGMYGSTWRVRSRQGGRRHDARALDPRHRRARVAARPGGVGERAVEHVPRQPGHRGHGRRRHGARRRRAGEPHQRVAPAARAAEPPAPRGDLRARLLHARARRDGSGHLDPPGRAGLARGRRAVQRGGRAPRRPLAEPGRRLRRGGRVRRARPPPRLRHRAPRPRGGRRRSTAAPRRGAAARRWTSARPDPAGEPVGARVVEARAAGAGAGRRGARRGPSRGPRPRPSRGRAGRRRRGCTGAS